MAAFTHMDIFNKRVANMGNSMCVAETLWSIMSVDRSSGTDTDTERERARARDRERERERQTDRQRELLELYSFGIR